MEDLTKSKHGPDADDIEDKVCEVVGEVEDNCDAEADENEDRE